MESVLPIAAIAAFFLGMLVLRGVLLVVLSGDGKKQTHRGPEPVVITRIDQLNAGDREPDQPDTENTP